MFRRWFALVLVLATLVPVPAAAAARAPVQASQVPAGIGPVEAAHPHDALRSPGGWELLRRLGPGRIDGRPRTPSEGTREPSYGAGIPEPAPGSLLQVVRVQGGDARPGAGSPRLRLEYLPYNATAPPRSR